MRHLLLIIILIGCSTNAEEVDSPTSYDFHSTYMFYLLTETGFHIHAPNEKIRTIYVDVMEIIEPYFYELQKSNTLSFSSEDVKIEFTLLLINRQNELKVYFGDHWISINKKFVALSDKDYRRLVSFFNIRMKNSEETPNKAFEPIIASTRKMLQEKEDYDNYYNSKKLPLPTVNIENNLTSSPENGTSKNTLASTDNKASFSSQSLTGDSIKKGKSDENLINELPKPSTRTRSPKKMDAIIVQSHEPKKSNFPSISILLLIIFSGLIYYLVKRRN